MVDKKRILLKHITAFMNSDEVEVILRKSLRFYGELGEKYLEKEVSELLMSDEIPKLLFETYKDLCGGDK